MVSNDLSLLNDGVEITVKEGKVSMVSNDLSLLNMEVIIVPIIILFQWSPMT